MLYQMNSSINSVDVILSCLNNGDANLDVRNQIEYGNSLIDMNVTVIGDDVNLLVNTTVPNIKVGIQITTLL